MPEATASSAAEIVGDWISLAAPAKLASNVVSGVIDPQGNWAVDSSPERGPNIVATDIHRADVSQIGRAFRNRTRAWSVD